MICFIVSCYLSGRFEFFEFGFPGPPFDDDLAETGHTEKDGSEAENHFHFGGSAVDSTAAAPHE